MIRNAVFGDFDNFTEKEQREIMEHINKKKPKLEKYAKKLEDQTYRLSKKKWFRAIWKAQHNVEDLDKFVKNYEKENKINE